MILLKLIDVLCLHQDRLSLNGCCLESLNLPGLRIEVTDNLLLWLVRLLYDDIIALNILIPNSPPVYLIIRRRSRYQLTIWSYLIYLTLTSTNATTSHDALVLGKSEDLLMLVL
jgi:hypothetical protein